MANVERRKSLRVVVNWRVQVNVPGVGIVPGIVKNISEKGLSIEVSASVKTGQIILMKVMAIIKGRTMEIMLRAQINHTRFLSGNRGTGAGCIFEEVTEPTKKLLNSVIEDPLLQIDK